MNLEQNRIIYIITQVWRTVTSLSSFLVSSLGHSYVHVRLLVSEKVLASAECESVQPSGRNIIRCKLSYQTEPGGYCIILPQWGDCQQISEESFGLSSS